MRKIINDNSGYALVTVLLMITIFMVLALSFMGQSVNSAKQNNITEENSQSVALAEMGSVFYKNAIMNEFDDISKAAKEAQSNYINELHKIVITNDDIKTARNYAINEAYRLLEDKLIKEQNSYLVAIRNNPIEIDNDSAKYIVKDVTLSDLKEKDNQKVTTITFHTTGISNGINENSETTIESKLEIDFSTIFNETSSNNGISIGLSNLIPDLDPTNICDNNATVFNGNRCTYQNSKSFHQSDKISFNNTILKVNGNLSYRNLNNADLNNSVLYVTGDFTNGNQNRLSRANIYVGNTGNFHNLNNASNVTIEVKGNAYFGNLQNGTNVLICANVLKEVKNIGSGVKLYAKVNETTNNDVIVGLDAFSPGGACSRATNTISWDAPTIINEQYNYKQ